jgi:hypothetical protein
MNVLSHGLLNTDKGCMDGVPSYIIRDMGYLLLL